MNIKDYFKSTATEVEAVLDEILTAPQPRVANLYAAMRYSVFAGGKRLRPALFCATLSAFGVDSRPLLPFAAGLEMIHTYSLIHDDLPAMDNDDYRRGKLTCHKVFGEAEAILAGDGLLTHAFAAMMSVKSAVAADNLVKAVNDVALMAGIFGMVAGQSADIEVEGQPVDAETLEYICRCKTGALFAAAVLGAADLSGANAKQVEVLQEYSYLLGLAFQIVDDVLDIKGDAVILGKTTGSDAKNGKTTFATLLGCDAAMEYAAETAKKAISLLEIFDEKAELLRAMPIYFIERNR